MRTLSSLIGRRVVTVSGEKLGRVHDLAADATGAVFEVTALCVGATGYLDRLGIGFGHRPNEIPWSSIVRIDGDQVVVRDP
jgi:sporulation protein YlmC with PRC-barrel domain